MEENNTFVFVTYTPPKFAYCLEMLKLLIESHLNILLGWRSHWFINTILIGRFENVEFHSNISFLFPWILIFSERKALAMELYEENNCFWLIKRFRNESQSQHLEWFRAFSKLLLNFKKVMKAKPMNIWASNPWLNYTHSVNTLF